MGYKVIFGTIFNQIGDVILLDTCLKKEILLRTSKKIILILGDCEKGNRYLVNKYSKYIKIIDWPSLSSFVWCIFSIFPLLRMNIVKFDSNDNEALLSKILISWDKKNYKPLLAPEKFDFKWKNIPTKLKDKIISGNFICIHSRDKGFYNDPHRSTRNYDIRVLNDLIQSVINTGTAVIRIGHQPEFIIEKKNLKNSHLYFDSCSSSSPIQDVYFLSNCLFYIGCSSGPAEVPSIFGIKSYLINTYPAVKGKGFSRGDVTIFKKIKNLTTNKYLNIDKYFSNPFDLPLQKNKLQSLGYKLEDNTNEEILMGFSEFLFVNRKSFPILYKLLFNEDYKDKILSLNKSNFEGTEKYFRPYHWCYKSLGIHSKLFVSSYKNLK